MQIKSVSNYQPKFRGYENPIDRKKEKNLAILSSAGASAAIGAATAGIATCFIQETSSHRYLKAGGIGAIIGTIALLLTLPSKLYNTKVGSFTREKEMDVYSRDKEVEKNLLTELDKNVKDEQTPLSEKINNYATIQMAKNGSGVLVKQGE